MPAIEKLVKKGGNSENLCGISLKDIFSELFCNNQTSTSSSCVLSNVHGFGMTKEGQSSEETMRHLFERISGKCKIFFSLDAVKTVSRTKIIAYCCCL
jgi:hypothetical protein